MRKPCNVQLSLQVCFGSVCVRRDGDIHWDVICMLQLRAICKSMDYLLLADRILLFGFFHPRLLVCGIQLHFSVVHVLTLKAILRYLIHHVGFNLL